MQVLFLGDGVLGDEVLRHLDAGGDRVYIATDVDHAQEMAQIENLDWLVSAGCRFIVPSEVLSAVGDSCNVHLSYLPWGRGAHPNVWAIVDGEPAGVSIHRMTGKLDAGPIFGQRRVETSFADTGADLYKRLVSEAGRLFGEIWPDMREGVIRPTPQPEGGSFHRVADLADLAALCLDEELTWGRALNILRALTFPPFQNILIQHDEGQYHVEINVMEVGV